MTSYDEVLYPTHAFTQTHPDRLAALAQIFGMRPAPLERCRVLELGCGDGGNLIPMAFNFPGGEFVGIDLAARPVAAGRALIEDLGLKNVALHSVGIEDIPADFGRFDYVIAHGVYSWVPEGVRDRIMRVCREHLSEQGVGYVSYNVLPGGHLRRVTREMMLWHVRGVSDPGERVARAVSLLELVGGALDESDPYALVTKGELERVKRFRPSYLFHDDLAEINAPVYFHEFVEHAARHGLQYLAEADYSDMGLHSLPGRAVEALGQLTAGGGDDPLLLEQYADFIKCRRFRQTLVCHREVTLSRERRPEVVRGLYLSSPLRPESAAPEVRSNSVEEFSGPVGGTLSTDSPLVKAAALIVGEAWPQVVGFEELLTEARARAGLDDAGRVEEDAQRLALVLLDAYAAGVFMMHAHRPRFVTRAGERPAASRLARVQLRHGPLVTSQRHSIVDVKDHLGQSLLLLLDGTRDRAALLAELSARIRSGEIRVGETAGGASAEQVLAALPEGLEKSLEGLAGNALLVS